MLRKILTILVVVGLVVTIGCKKKESQPVMPSGSEIQKQAETAGDQAAKDAAAAKQAAEKAAQELQKTAPAK